MTKKDIGQLASAASVVLSLLFVGFEIRQNTAIARLSAAQAFMADQSELFDLVATDPILAPLMQSVMAGAQPDEFGDVERFRIDVHLRRIVRGWEGLFAAVREGVLPRDALVVVGAGGVFNNPYFRGLWPRLRPSFSPDFVEFFELLEWNRQESPAHD